MKLYTYAFIAGIIFSNVMEANPLLRVGSNFLRAARSSVQNFRSEFSKDSIHVPEVKPSESQASVININNQQDVAPILQEVMQAAGQQRSPVTINVIHAPDNKGNIGSTFTSAKASISTSTKKTEQRTDHSFNQETKQNPSSGTFSMRDLKLIVGSSAATLAIVEAAHYIAG